ncbi:MAG: sulfotransferase [Chloroflexi bacterium]|nr:sulfotransferase [Chloroflexota bacterium]
MNQGPIYLAGADRSGTTLMYALLATHPNIALPHLGSNMWTFFYGQYGDLRQSENFERCLAAMLRYKNVLILNPDVERIRSEFRQGDPTYARLFALFHNHFLERTGKRRWGDKTSYVERYADPIFAAYSEAVMVHMIRDPRDRFASAIKRWPNQKGQVGGATVRWLYSVRLAQRNLRKYPDRYKIVRYETLVSQPEATLGDICTFLGEKFDPVMLTMSGAEGYVGKGGNSSFEKFQPAQITTTAVGRYRKALSRRQIQFIQAFASRDMRQFDYALENFDLSLQERATFFLMDLPTNTVRMTLWRALEAIQLNLPSWLGRTPMRHRLVTSSNS